MTETNAPILIVEDQREIRAFVRSALEAEGFSVVEAGNLAQAADQLAKLRPILSIVDLGLPDGDGMTLIRALREWSQLPVLILSARSTEAEKVAALDAGADDYLTKPFGVRELLARIRALLRRPQTDGDEALVQFGAVCVDRVHRTVTRGGIPVALTPIEFRLLSVLLANAGRVLTQRQLLREVWGSGHAERSHYLRIYIGHLRRKLEDDPAQPQYLLTETGVGYRFVIAGTGAP